MSSWSHASERFTTLDHLIDFAWSAPIRELAAKTGLSDVGLRKWFVAHGVARPPQGYWNKAHASRRTSPRPKALARRAGETGRIRLEGRLADLVTCVDPIPVDGPFASAVVPEDLEQLRDQVTKAVGRVAVPRTLDRHHPGLADVLTREERRRAKAAASTWVYDKPHFDGPLEQRRLRLLNGIFLALAKHGGSGAVREEHGALAVHARVGDTSVPLGLSVVGKHRTQLFEGYTRDARDLPASTPLQLIVDGSVSRTPFQVWQDGTDGKLESKLPCIVVSIIVAGEAAFRRGLRAHVEWLEQTRLLHEQHERERLERLNQARVKALEQSAAALQQADHVRALVARVKAREGELGLDDAALAAWEHWALGHADQLDPLLSGALFSHFNAPR
jgi:hypothetical protein